MTFTIFQNEKTPFQALKTRSSKSQKIDFFSKGVNPCFWPKNGHFSKFFLGIIGQENIFYDIPERKNAFLGKKNKKFKKSKMAIFPTYFFRQYRPGKCLLRYSRAVKMPFQAIKTRNSKSQKIDIFPKGVNPCLWSKNGHFSNFFFQALLGRKMSFTIFQNEKTPVQAIKTRSSKCRKMAIFPKTVNPWF